MKVPLGWRREFVPTIWPWRTLAEQSRTTGSRSRGSNGRGGRGSEGVVVARVLEVRDHPTLEKLCLARIQRPPGRDR